MGFNVYNDATECITKEGNKTYEYGWLDKVLKVTENGKTLADFEYHNNGQIAKAIRPDKTENFLWDGLALVKRDDTKFINEPHAGGGNPVLAIQDVDADKSKAIFTDMLGTSLGSTVEDQYNNISKTSFGADSSDTSAFFTGKPYINELGYAFLFRNYRADTGKWLSQDLLLYPDGWNNLAYCNSNTIMHLDLFGCVITSFSDALNFYAKNTNPNATETIGDNVLNEFFLTDQYNTYEQELKNSAQNISSIQCNGTISAAKTISWEQGLVLGRTASKTTDSLNWTASNWTKFSESQESRVITVSGNLIFTTTDYWDFKAHENDPWYMNLIKETIPGGIATVYSYLTQGQSGTPYNLTGSITKNISFTITQYRSINEE